MHSSTRHDHERHGGDTMIQKHFHGRLPCAVSSATALCCNSESVRVNITSVSILIVPHRGAGECPIPSPDTPHPRFDRPHRPDRASAAASRSRVSGGIHSPCSRSPVPTRTSASVAATEDSAALISATAASNLALVAIPNRKRNLDSGVERVESSGPLITEVDVRVRLRVGLLQTQVGASLLNRFAGKRSSQAADPKPGRASVDGTGCACSSASANSTGGNSFLPISRNSAILARSASCAAVLAELASRSRSTSIRSKSTSGAAPSRTRSRLN